jgi:hypothetical protein
MFTLQITLGNEAMQTPEDVAGAIRGRLGQIALADPTGDFGHIRDLNGNRVGEWRYEPA